MKQPRREYPTLDLLRVLAVGCTILFHTPGVMQRVFFLRPFANGMWLGVDLFMLISGWLLGGQLLRDAARGSFDPKRFYVKRWLRTLPLYYVMLLVLYFGGYGGDAEFAGPLPWKTVLVHVLFLQKYFGPNLYGVSWSLCVEEHFYLALPLIVLLLMRFPRLPVVLGLVFGMEAVSILCRVEAYSPLLGWIPQQTHMRCHGLFVGLALSWVHLHRRAYWARLGPIAEVLGLVGAVGTALVMASIPAVASRWASIGVPTVGTWTLALLFVASVHERSRLARVSFPGLQYLGELTFAIYLVHHQIPRSWLGGHASDAGMAGLGRHFALMIGLSVLLHHLVERPVLAFRGRLLERWRSTPAPVTVSA